MVNKSITYDVKLSSTIKYHDIWRWKSRFWLQTRYKHLAVLNRFIGIKPLLDYWIANDNSDINKP